LIESLAGVSLAIEGIMIILPALGTAKEMLKIFARLSLAVDEAPAAMTWHRLEPSPGYLRCAGLVPNMPPAIE
jgi:hypothetical protein